MKLIWYLISVLLIFLILISNPKSTNLGGFSGEGNIVSTTRSSQRTLQILIAFNILLFLLLTIWLLIPSVI